MNSVTCCTICYDIVTYISTWPSWLIGLSSNTYYYTIKTPFSLINVEWKYLVEQRDVEREPELIVEPNFVAELVAQFSGGGG